MKLSCEFSLRNLPKTNVTTAKDLSKNYINVRPSLARHFKRNRLLSVYNVNVKSSDDDDSLRASLHDPMFGSDFFSDIVSAHRNVESYQ